MTRRVRFGLLGLGMMGRHHARVLHTLEGVELVAVADRDGDRHRVAAGLPVLETLSELIRFGIDACVVAVPTDDHAPAGLVLADAGIPTLIEKPLAQDVQGGYELVRAFERAGVPACVGHVERYNPALRSLRTRLEAGELGTIYQIVTRRQGPFPDRVKDVGVVKDLATHDIDLTAWVAGSPFASIAARTACRAGRSHEDLVAAVGTLADTTVTSHLVNWLTPTKERRVVVTGERGCFQADTLSADLTFYRNGQVPTAWERISSFQGVTEGDMTRFAIAKPEPLLTELPSFRDAVLGKPADVVPLAEGLRALAVAEAFLDSAEKGQVVELAVPA